MLRNRKLVHNDNGLSLQVRVSLSLTAVFVSVYTVCSPGPSSVGICDGFV